MILSAAIIWVAIVAYWNWMRHFERETLMLETNVVLNTTNDKKLRVPIAVYLPRDSKPPFASVVIVPSSGGVEEVREIYYAEQLTAQGVAAVVVDSFAARGVEDSLYDQSRLETWQVENDAWAALRYLHTDQRFHPGRVAIMGVSKGGTVAMNTAHTVHRAWAGIRRLKFAAHIAISPDCVWTARSDATTGAPVLFLLAGRDDQTPVKPCIAKADRLRAAGNSKVEVNVYPEAYHAWEELGARPFYNPKVENFATCRVWVRDDGSMIAAGTENVIPADAWHEWAKENCMTLGGTCCGGSRELKNKATLDVVDFLRRSRIATPRNSRASQGGVSERR